MTGPVFVDSNVFVYGRDASEPVKQGKAAAWIEQLWRTRTGRLSTQVLHEFYVTVTRKLEPGMKHADARRDIRNLMTWRPVPLEATLIERAWGVQDRHGLSFWDSLIVAAAQDAGCRYVLTEDLNPGQRLDGLTVVNPFTVEFEEID